MVPKTPDYPKATWKRSLLETRLLSLVYTLIYKNKLHRYPFRFYQRTRSRPGFCTVKNIVLNEVKFTINRWHCTVLNHANFY